MTGNLLLQDLKGVRTALGWDETSDCAKEWWEEFEELNLHQLHLLMALGEELRKRSATIEDFYLAYVYGSTEDVKEVLSFLDRIYQDKSIKDESEECPSGRTDSPSRVYH